MPYSQRWRGARLGAKANKKLAPILKFARDDPGMRNNPFVGIGMLFAPAIIDRAVDAYVTPDSIALMVRAARKPGSEEIDSSNEPPPSSRPRTSYSYRSLDRFRARLTRPGDTPGEAVGLVFERRGLFAWRLIRIDLPSVSRPRPPTRR